MGGHWPTQVTVQDLVGNVVSYVMGKLKDADVYFIFDRYEDYSIKGVTCTAHGKEASTYHTQSTVTVNAYSTSKVVLAVSLTYNKIQLVDVIVETMLAQKQQQQLSSTNHKLVVTGRDPVPVEISHGMTIRREDLRNAHEEADVIISH